VHGIRRVQELRRQLVRDMLGTETGRGRLGWMAGTRRHWRKFGEDLFRSYKEQYVRSVLLGLRHTYYFWSFFLIIMYIPYLSSSSLYNQSFFAILPSSTGPNFLVSLQTIWSPKHPCSYEDIRPIGSGTATQQIAPQQQQQQLADPRLRRHFSKSRSQGKMWTPSSALFFAATTIATIGYGQPPNGKGTM
jgi:hypothetical protein